MSIQLHMSRLLECLRLHWRSNAFVGPAVVLFTACMTSVEPRSTPPVKLVALASQLSGTVGIVVYPPPTILLTDVDGTPIPGAMLSVEVTGGGGSVGTTDLRTGPFGTASTSWTLGTKAGVNTLTIRMSGTPALDFVAVARAGPARYMDVSGERQTGQLGAERVSAKVQDEFANPVSGATVSFSVVSGGGTIDGNTAVTDSSGIARSGTWTLGPGPGLQEVRVRSGPLEATLAATGVDCRDPIPGSCAAPMEMVFRHVRDHQLYRVRSDGAGLIRLTRDGWNHDPAWSPDGNRIAFIRTDPGSFLGDVWIMNADGTNAVQRTANRRFASVAWSPDGRKLAVSPEGLYVSTMSIIDTSGADERFLGGDARRPAWSPDGQRIAFIRPSGDPSRDDGYETVWVMNADGTGQRQLTPPGVSIWARMSWLPDGSAVVFTDGGTVYVANVDGSGTREIVVDGIVGGAALSRDGNWFAFTFWDNVVSGQVIGYMPSAGGSRTLLLRDAFGPMWRP
jgi:WD40-like Beta Propeller Repeat